MTAIFFYIFLICIFSILIVGHYLGIKKALLLESEQKLKSRPYYYGWYCLIWMSIPAFLFYVILSILSFYKIFYFSPFLTYVFTFLFVVIGLLLSLKNITPKLNARVKVEKFIDILLLVCAGITILVTIGIVLSIFFESLKFFKNINIFDFIFGTKWEPDTAFLGGAGRGDEMVAEPKFGSVPLFAGTVMITLIAMFVAVPTGLFSAIYLSEYASKNIRKKIKPLLEILAGIPTVVYGFFAAITVSPLVVKIAESLGLKAEYTNALAPGIVMGIMIIPYISSLSDDVINAVPKSLREGSLALGTTKSETIKHVVLPAALPGIFSAIILAVSRAIGETMIVVMAAGLRPNLTLNPLEGMTTVTVRIVDALVGDQEFGSLETLSAFGLGFVLLLITLILNIFSMKIVRRFREKYE
ncbi:phosphate ABC transporter permease subunit PstC [Deferribacteraceae bacterium V6Fe1]|nr:phosphate ABC transporter permease subunit PstC [Deferribacteraceae bacterium V6Fe1]